MTQLQLMERRQAPFIGISNYFPSSLTASCRYMIHPATPPLPLHVYICTRIRACNYSVLWRRDRGSLPDVSSPPGGSTNWRMRNYLTLHATMEGLALSVFVTVAYQTRVLSRSGWAASSVFSIIRGSHPMQELTRTRFLRQRMKRKII